MRGLCSLRQTLDARRVAEAILERDAYVMPPLATHRGITRKCCGDLHRPFRSPEPLRRKSMLSVEKFVRNVNYPLVVGSDDNGAGRQGLAFKRQTLHSFVHRDDEQVGDAFLRVRDEEKSSGLSHGLLLGQTRTRKLNMGPSVKRQRKLLSWGNAHHRKLEGVR